MKSLNGVIFVFATIITALLLTGCTTSENIDKIPEPTNSNIFESPTELPTKLPTEVPSDTPGPDLNNQQSEFLTEFSFRKTEQVFVPMHSWDVDLGDLDGDGDLDAFVANDDERGIRVWFNDGEGMFTESQQTLPPFFRAALGDLDGDGDLDAIVTNIDKGNPTWLSDAGVWMNDGFGNFSLSQNHIGGAEVFNMDIADLNGDGHLDIFFAAIALDSVWLNDGSGYFIDTGQEFETGIDAVVTLGDMDADGDVDALTGGWEGPAKVWLNDGKGYFILGSEDMMSQNLHIHALGLGDFDLDGDLDTFAGLANGSPHQIWFNDGAGNFSVKQTLEGQLVQGATIWDINNDGYLDILSAHGYYNNGEVRIWLNNGTGFFNAYELRLGTSYSTSIGVGDLDFDGDWDLFTTHTNWIEGDDGEMNIVWFNEVTNPPSTEE